MKLEIFNFLNPTELGNILVYPVFLIFMSYCVAFLLYLYNPKSRNLVVLISIPIFISIIAISVSALCQINELFKTTQMSHNLRLFQLFILCIGMLVASGYQRNFQVKYIFVSHTLSEIIHIYAYFYFKHYDTMGIIVNLFHPALAYIIVLAFVHAFVSNYLFAERIKLSVIGHLYLDPFLPTNEANSYSTIILLQAYSMIIYSTFVTFLHSSEDIILLYIVIPLVILLQLIIIALCLRIMDKYPKSANVPFYVSAHLMIVKLLAKQLYKNYKIGYILFITNFVSFC